MACLKVRNMRVQTMANIESPFPKWLPFNRASVGQQNRMNSHRKYVCSYTLRTAACVNWKLQQSKSDNGECFGAATYA